MHNAAGQIRYFEHWHICLPTQINLPPRSYTKSITVQMSRPAQRQVCCQPTAWQKEKFSNSLLLDKQQLSVKMTSASLPTTLNIDEHQPMGRNKIFP